MTDSWLREILAVFRKEATSELRNRSGLITTGLFSVITVVAVSLAAFGNRIPGGLGAGLIWVALLFASVVALPRTFLVEEELGTTELLRLISRPHAVFWGKALFNLVLMLITGATLSFLFIGFTGSRVTYLGLYALSLAGGCGALAGAVTLCGALVAQAANRAALAGAVSLPVLFPVLLFGVSGLKVALGDGDYGDGLKAAIGLVGYGGMTLAMGPYLFAEVWKK